MRHPLRRVADVGSAASRQNLAGSDMSLNKLLPVVFLSGLLSVAPGCGGAGDGVADAPEEPAPELTPEEETGEQDYTGNPEYTGQ